jgi:hypothetical protein
MFDDLRPKGSVFDEDPDPNAEPENDELSKTIFVPATETPTSRSRRSSASSGPEIRILGMTAAQRLVIAIMLFLNVAVLGCFLLVATGAVVLPGQ